VGLAFCAFEASRGIQGLGVAGRERTGSLEKIYSRALVSRFLVVLFVLPVPLACSMLVTPVMACGFDLWIVLAEASKAETMLSNKLLQGQELIEADQETGTEEVEDMQRSRSVVVFACRVRWLWLAVLQMLSAIFPRPPDSGVLRRPEPFVRTVMSSSEVDCGAYQQAKQAGLGQ
jgi:hypothetical protein